MRTRKRLYLGGRVGRPRGGLYPLLTEVPPVGEFNEQDFTYGLISRIAVNPLARCAGAGKQL